MVMSKPELKIKKIYIPSLTLELESDTLIVLEIVHSLGVVSLDKTNLVYRGVDGTDIERTSKVPDLEATFATDYKSFVNEAAMYDRTHHAETNYPLLNARQAENLPAVVVYDRSSLELVEGADHLWAPKPDSSLAVAARAVIFFADKG